MTSFGTVGGKWENGAAPRDASPGGRLPLTSEGTRREGRAMMPDPNSPTSATPLASLDPRLLQAAAVRLLAADQQAILRGAPGRSEHLIALARTYGLDDWQIDVIYRTCPDTCHRLIVTGEVPR